MKDRQKSIHSIRKSMDSIQNKLIIITVLFAIVPLLIVNIISASLSKNTLKDTSKQLTMDIVRQICSSIDYYIEDTEKNVTKFVINDLNDESLNLINKYNTNEKDNAEKIKVVQPIGKLLTYLSSIEKNIESAAIVHKDGTVIGKLPQVSAVELAEVKDLEIQGESLWQKGFASETSKIYFMRKVPNTVTGDTFGVIISLVKLDRIIQDIEETKLLEGANIYLVDAAGQMIYNKDSSKEIIESYVGEFIQNDQAVDSIIKNNIMITYATASNGWRVIVEVPEKSLTTNLDKGNIIVWSLVILSVLLAVAVGVVIAKGFSTPIINIMELMKRAEYGDLTVEVKSKRTDEIGMLCISFNKMINNIKKLLEETQMVIVNTIEDGKTLKSSTVLSAEAFEQLALSIDDITRGSSHQAEDAQNSSMAMAKLSHSIQEVMAKTKTILGDNQDAKELIGGASASIEHLNATMKSSVKVSGQIRDSITELSILTRSIREIMKLVDGISEQTNLLALNASIEAARAGEVGRGFAVVAHEVRNLAEQSKQSTHNVRKTLNTIEKKTIETVDLVKDANAIFANQEEAVKKAYNAFNIIIERLKNMDIELGNVNGQVKDMETLKDDMMDKISRIKMVTEETASATQEVNALSEEQKAITSQLSMLANGLTTTMDELSSSIQAFKIKKAT